MTAASMASRAEPPRERMDQPAARARWQPDLQASTASSGVFRAPPGTMRDGFIRKAPQRRRKMENRNSEREIGPGKSLGSKRGNKEDTERRAESSTGSRG